MLKLVAGRDFRFQAGEHSALHPGQTAELVRDDQVVGYVGALHPSLAKQFDLGKGVYLFEVKLAAVTERRVPSFQTPSRYPEVRRDLALVIDRKIPAQSVLDAARAAAGEHLVNLNLFDIYEGEGIDPQRKSLAIGLTYRDSSRTLNEEEVNESVGHVIRALEEGFGATLRN